MLKKVYYYNLQDMDSEYYPFKKINLISFLKTAWNTEDLTSWELPSDLTSNATIYNELISLVFGRFHEHAIIKIVKYINEDPQTSEIYNKFMAWVNKLVAWLNDSHDYYVTLLTNYNSAKADLMADITATSKNKVKFNDTPQNPNTSDVYEGDNYITHFTATEGETKSPLMSKIMRLKEIQDAYKDVMSDWVKSFERIFYQEEVEYNYE